MAKESADNKPEELNTTIELSRQENGFEMVKENILTSDGKIIMDKIKTQIEKK